MTRPITFRSIGLLADLSELERTTLLASMRSTWTEGLVSHLPPGTGWPENHWAAVEEGYATGARAEVALRGDELVGFQLTSTCVVGTRRYLVFHATAIRSDLQSSGVAFAMTTRTTLAAYWRERCGRLYVVGRYFNPIAFAGVFVTVPDRSRLHPSIEPETAVRPGVVDAATSYVRARYPNAAWDPLTSVLVVPAEMPAPPFRGRSGVEIVDQWWNLHMATPGGSVLCASEITPWVILTGVPLIARAASQEFRRRRRGTRHPTPTDARSDPC
jgi:hypothetical protein